MIDQQIIDASIKVRKRFLSIVEEINKNQDELKKMAFFLQQKMDELKRIESEEFKNKPTKEEITRISEIIVKEIEDIEIAEKRLSRKFANMSEELELLQKEESVIYESIKNRYPDLSDEEIREQIAEFLDE